MPQLLVMGSTSMTEALFEEEERTLPTLPQEEAIAYHVQQILELIGEDVTREGLLETPGRVARMYLEVFSGLQKDPGSHLQKQFTTPSNAMVVVKDIPFTSFCEHHLAAFPGIAHVGYLPGPVKHTLHPVDLTPYSEQQPGAYDPSWECSCGDTFAEPTIAFRHPRNDQKRYRITGLSKLARVVREFAARPQVQENLTAQIADCIESVLEPLGTIVTIKAEHSCMSHRGVKTHGVSTVTTAVRGLFDTDADGVKREFFEALKL